MDLFIILKFVVIILILLIIIIIVVVIIIKHFLYLMGTNTKEELNLQIKIIFVDLYCNIIF